MWNPYISEERKMKKNTTQIKSLTEPCEYKRKKCKSCYSFKNGVVKCSELPFIGLKENQKACSCYTKRKKK